MTSIHHISAPPPGCAHAACAARTQPSARAADPRFARFERWRREVIPDLEYQLEFWVRPVEGHVEAWRLAREQVRAGGRVGA